MVTGNYASCLFKGVSSYAGLLHYLLFGSNHMKEHKKRLFKNNNLEIIIFLFQIIRAWRNKDVNIVEKNTVHSAQCALYTVRPIKLWNRKSIVKS